MACGWCVVGTWRACGRCVGGMCLALGVLQRCQATVLPLWQLRGCLRGPHSAPGEGLLAARLLQSRFSCAPGMAWAWLSLWPEELVSWPRSYSEISRRPLCPVSGTDPTTQSVAPPARCLPLSLTPPPVIASCLPTPYSFSAANASLTCTCLTCTCLTCTSLTCTASRILTRPLGLSPYQLLGGLGVSSLGRALDPSQHTLKTKHRLLPVAAQVCGSTSCRLLDPSPWPQAHGETFRTSQYAKYTKHAKGPTLAWSFAHVLLPPGFSSLPSL